MIKREALTLSQFQYELPDDRIARFPLPRRDQSKLLVCRHGQITHDRFANLTDYLPKPSFLVFNNTKVIPARLYFTKPTGAVVGQQPFGGARGSGTNDKAGSMINLLRWESPRTIKETFDPPTDYRYPFLVKDV